MFSLATTLTTPPLLLLLLLSLLSLHFTMHLGFHTHLFALLSAHSSPSSSTPPPPFPIGPQPFPRTYTGISPIDCLLMDVVGYFTVLIHGEQSWGTRLSWVYFMGQFVGIWEVVASEGWREGNRGRLIRHTHILGLIFQIASLAFILPLYLLLHLLTQPPSSSSSSSSPLIPPTYSHAGPLATLLSFTLPVILMSLPPTLLPAPHLHYANALWQIFPLTHRLYHCLLIRYLPSSSPSTKLPTTYTSAFYHSALPHWALLFLFLLPLLPYSSIPPFITPADLTPYTFSTAPVISLPDLPSTGPEGTASRILLTKTAQTFLIWDILFSSASYLVWVVAQGVRGGSSLGGTLLRTVGWTVVAGPGAAGAVVLGKRDKDYAERAPAKKTT